MSIIDTSLAAEMLENRLKGLNKFIDRWDMVWYYVTIMKAGFGDNNRTGKGGLRCMIYLIS